MRHHHGTGNYSEEKLLAWWPVLLKLTSGHCLVNRSWMRIFYLSLSGKKNYAIWEFFDCVSVARVPLWMLLRSSGLPVYVRNFRFTYMFFWNNILNIEDTTLEVISLRRVLATLFAFK